MHKKIAFADETGIVYEKHKSSLESTWDSLSTYYQEKTIEYQAEHMSIQSLITRFQAARVELETMHTTCRLVREGVLKCVMGVDSKISAGHGMTRKIVADSQKIAGRKLNMLRGAREREANLVRNIEKYNCTMENGAVKIVLDNEHYVVVEGDRYLYPAQWKPSGLKCTMEYRGRVYEGVKQCTGAVCEIERLFEYIAEQKGIGVCKRGDITIKIEECREISGGDKICIIMIEKLKLGCGLDVVYEICVCFLSRVAWRGLLIGKEYEIVNGFGDSLLDGLSREYFVASEVGIVRVVRAENSFEIFLNENEVIKVE